MIVSQVYVPDPASVGQHLHDAAVEMVRRGFRVCVTTSAAGYDDPSARYPEREELDGVEIRRLGLSSFGKGSLLRRVAAGTAFLAQALVASLTNGRVDLLLVSTSPPMCSALGAVLDAVRDVPFVYWAMDINPDQAVAMGKVAARSVPARALDLLNRRILSRARRVVTLDDFMLARLEAKHALGGRASVMPPWPHVEDDASPLPHADNAFRREHGLEDHFVVMYSGNLSPSHPIETVLDAAVYLRDEQRLRFVFVGGGQGRAEVERFVAQHGLKNVGLLPYQPLSRLHESLSAADLHLVSVGDAMVGVVHPCKIYGVMAVGRPVLLLGPERSHVGNILRDHQLGWRVDHGDVRGAVAAINAALQMPQDELMAMGARGRVVVRESFGKARLRKEFCDVLEAAWRS